jgi:hypothetical protein
MKGLQVFLAIIVQIVVFWVVRPWSLVGRYILEAT